MSKTYEFVGPSITKISATGGITYDDTFTVRVPSTEGKVVWSGLTVGSQKTVEDSLMIKILDLDPNWEELV